MKPGGVTFPPGFIGTRRRESVRGPGARLEGSMSAARRLAGFATRGSPPICHLGQVTAGTNSARSDRPFGTQMRTCEYAILRVITGQGRAPTLDVGGAEWPALRADRQGCGGHSARFPRDDLAGLRPPAGFLAPIAHAPG